MNNTLLQQIARRVERHPCLVTAIDAGTRNMGVAFYELTPHWMKGHSVRKRHYKYELVGLHTARRFPSWEDEELIESFRTDLQAVIDDMEAYYSSLWGGFHLVHVIEYPIYTQYTGRQNTQALGRVYMQCAALGVLLRPTPYFVSSHEWNVTGRGRQRSQKVKDRDFLYLFEGATETRGRIYWTPKEANEDVDVTSPYHGKKILTNADVRDAALIGRYFIERLIITLKTIGHV